MKKLLITLGVAGFLLGLIGATAVSADTNTNTPPPTNTGGTVTNVSWGYVKCIYSGRAGSCSGGPQQIPADPDDKTKG
jgi:hypothetical protein